MRNYWVRYSREQGGRPVRGRRERPLTPMGRMERHQEAYHDTQARCPTCNRWKYMKVIQDTWVGGAVPKLRLQCECGYVFTHDPLRHDHVLERSPGSGTGRRGTYKPRGWRRMRSDGRALRD